MKLHRLVAFGLSSSLLLGSAVSLTFFPSQALANQTQDQLISQQVTVLSSSNFVTVEQDHQTTGQVRLIRLNGKRYLDFDSEFTTAQGPDVEIILYRGQEVPLKVSEEDYITLAKLKSFNGSQRYEIPDNIDLDNIESIGIWCRKFNVTFAYASLSSM
ncbi:MAG: DM13 domain-containing protein [Crocosphaera sp.]|nr:DM13 domain-containing protein [Crocosphaera sp.]